MERFYIQAFGALVKSGIYSSSNGYTPWKNEQAGQPLNVQRKQVFGKPYIGFGKLNAPDKLAFSATALLFSGFSDYNAENTGISLGSLYGSFSTDLRYTESVAAGFPRPAFFSATLPSSPIAEAAIIFKLKGPNRIIVGGAAPGLNALDSAIRILSLKKAESMVVLLINGIESCDIDFPFITKKNAPSQYSYALMINSKKCSLGINQQIYFSLNSDTINNNSQNSSEEFYFFEMINALMHKKNYSSTFNINGTTGSIILEMDE